MLDIIETAFEKNNIKFVRLDGTMSRKDRDVSLQNFKNSDSITACLISLKVGGLGLNLVWATQVFLMDRLIFFFYFLIYFF
jgi:SNF2 family DNA or RNA helicase